MKNEEKKLKPVVFVQGARILYRENKYGENLLLKAMMDGTTDPAKLRKAAHMSSIAEVYRSLDKLSLRKEYHEALSKNGVSMDMIVKGIKGIAETSMKDTTRLKGYDMLLKSLGLDKYEKNEDSGKNWEELINEASNAKVQKNLLSGDTSATNKIEAIKKYDVEVPEIPQEYLDKEKEEEELADQLYS